jgi:hypothetical protein
MRYLLLVCSDGTMTPEQVAVLREHVGPWVEEYDARGVRGYGEPLASPSTAVTVRRRDGETLLSDGPFVEAKDFVAGLDLIEATDLDHAVAVAAAHPMSWLQSIEVRPFSAHNLGLDPGDAAEIGAPPAGRERYLLLMCADGIAGTDEEEAWVRSEGEAWWQRVGEAGVRVYGTALAPPHTATTVRVRDGDTLLSDGPFVEAKEFIAGFTILDCMDQAEAVGFASEHPLASFHKVEVRRFVPFD